MNRIDVDMTGKDIFGKCGYNCGRCPSYRENIKTDEDRKRCSDGWYKYHGFRITPLKIRSCDGCQAPDDENPVRYISCRVRKCALRMNAKTCAHCSAYPCLDVSEVGNSAGLLEQVVARSGASVPEEDYAVFIEPYEGIKHLDQIRASLDPHDIVEMMPKSLKPRVVDFPYNLPLSQEKRAAFRNLHRLLVALNTIHGVPYARKEALNKRRQHLLKILWGFSLHGQFEEDRPILVMDSQAYLSQKLLSYPLEKVKSHLAAFEEFGALCELVSEEERGWLTPTGALKRGKWLVKMSFDQRLGGADTLKVLKEFSTGLEKKYGRQAFKHFSQADMRFLRDIA